MSKAGTIGPSGAGPQPHPGSVKVTAIMSSPVITAAPSTSIKEAARLLVQHDISAMPVLDDHGNLIGIVSEADLIKVEGRPDPRSQATPLPPSAGSTPRTVAQVMTRDVISVRAGTEVSQAVRTMLDAGIKRVPVMDGGRVVGVVSRRDLMRVIARSDDAVRRDVAARLKPLGVAHGITVDVGVVTVGLAASDRERALIESVALGVSGVLEVRFSSEGTP